MKTVKTYQLNKDFKVECETVESSDFKQYSVRLIFTCEDFSEELETFEGLVSPEEANAKFKYLVGKYKEGVKFSG